MVNVTRIENDKVNGWLERPAKPSAKALVLTHGASSDANAAILKAISARLIEQYGWTVLRCNLPFRFRRGGGPPRPTEGAADRQGLRDALALLRAETGPDVKLYMGGHSYGGRQTSMLAAEDEGLDASAFLFTSYPLHPPGKPAQLRTAHFSTLRKPALFVQGTRDAFGSRAEMEEALRLIPATTQLLMVDGAGHDLGGGKKLAFVDAFVEFAASV
jgi:uncharacterized protein